MKQSGSIHCWTPASPVGSLHPPFRTVASLCRTPASTRRIVASTCRTSRVHLQAASVSSPYRNHRRITSVHPWDPSVHCRPRAYHRRLSNHPPSDPESPPAGRERIIALPNQAPVGPLRPPEGSQHPPVGPPASTTRPKRHSPDRSVTIGPSASTS
ncbi:uncharacterized protein LOC134290222 [Aedes albopictus]|uniref:Uncharacterized protein n=1 Tax=Aedes albopictus TaxID=7160 RepID=A0ABM1XMU0_AEDAL